MRPASRMSQGDLDAALMQAASFGSPEDVRRALARGGNAKMREEDGATPLMSALWLDRFGNALILAPLSDPLAMDRAGRDALMCAAEVGALDCLRALLPGSDPMRADAMGFTALMRAAKASWLGRQLREAKAGVLPGEDEDSVVLWIHQQALGAVLALLPVSDLGARNKEGQSALDLARAGGHVRIESLLTVWVERRDLAEQMGPGASEGKRSPSI